MSRAIGDIGRPLTLREQRIRIRRGFRRIKVPASLILLLCAAAFCCVLCVWSRQMVIHTAYRISEANRRLEVLTLENRRLNLEISTLKSPRHLGRAAERLGLHEPRAGQILRIQ